MKRKKKKPSVLKAGRKGVKSRAKRRVADNPSASPSTPKKRGTATRKSGSPQKRKPVPASATPRKRVRPGRSSVSSSKPSKRSKRSKASTDTRSGTGPLRRKTSTPARARGTGSGVRKPSTKRKARPKAPKLPTKRRAIPKLPTKRKARRTPAPKPKSTKARDKRLKPWEQAKKPLPIAQLRDERPLAQAFLEALASTAYPGTYTTALNADHTIDGQAKIEKPEGTKASTFVDALESQFWMVLGLYPGIGGWWLRLGAQFHRTENEWRKYELDIFQGKETVMTNQTRLVKDGAEVWKSLRMIIKNVINAHQAPNPRTGQLRPVYVLTHLLIRIHRGAEAPLY